LRHRLQILILLGALAAACSEGPERRPKDAEVNLVPGGELEEVEARLVARGEVWRSRRCPRPVLRGDRLPGSGSDALAALIAGNGGDGAGALSKVSAVIAHEDICSPWLPGVRADPMDRGVVAAMIEAQAAREDLRPDAALRDALDLVRLQQDLVRGGGSAAWVAQVVHPFRLHLAPHLARLIDAPGLSDAALEEAIQALGLLIDTEPAPGVLVAAWTYRLFVQEWQPRLHGIFWLPPGGWDPGHPYRWHWDEESAYIDQRSEKAILLLALDRHLDALERACPEDATPDSCVRGLYGLMHIEADGKGGVRRLVKALTGPDPHGVFLDWFTGISAANMGKQAWVMVAELEQLAWRRLRLAQLRVHAAAVAAARKTGSCPDDATAEAHALQALLEDPALGGQLNLTRGDLDTWSIRPAGRFTDARVNAWGLEHRFRCPR